MGVSAYIEKTKGSATKMTSMKVISIKTFIDPMKKIHKRRIKTSDLIIDLDDLFIQYGSNTLYLTQQTCNYGGHRYYFICPECCKASYKLYSLEEADNWKCNTCIGLKRRTLNRTKTDCAYYWELAIKEAKKIDPKYKQADYLPGSFIFPPRPKGMNNKRYYKHYKKFMHYYTKGEQAYMSSVYRILGQSR